MDILLGDISSLVFRLVLRNDIEISLDKQMYRLITELDGEKSIGLIARRMGLNIDDLKEIISKLLKLKMIEVVDRAPQMLNNDFFSYLKDQFSLAIGPYAELLIEDAVMSLGYDISQFPKSRAPELIDLLSKKISDEGSRAIFKRNLISKTLAEEV